MEVSIASSPAAEERLASTTANPCWAPIRFNSWSCTNDPYVLKFLDCFDQGDHGDFRAHPAQVLARHGHTSRYAGLHRTIDIDKYDGNLMDLTHRRQSEGGTIGNDDVGSKDLEF